MMAVGFLVILHWLSLILEQ